MRACRQASPGDMHCCVDMTLVLPGLTTAAYAVYPRNLRHCPNTSFGGADITWCYLVQETLLLNHRKTAFVLQVGDYSAAWKPANCCGDAARAKQAVPLAPKGGGLAGMGQQAAPPGPVGGFPPTGALPRRGLADLAPTCTVCQAVKKPGHGCNGAFHC